MLLWKTLEGACGSEPARILSAEIVLDSTCTLYLVLDVLFQREPASKLIFSCLILVATGLGLFANGPLCCRWRQSKMLRFLNTLVNFWFCHN